MYTTSMKHMVFSSIHYCWIGGIIFWIIFFVCSYSSDSLEIKEYTDTLLIQQCTAYNAMVSASDSVQSVKQPLVEADSLPVHKTKENDSLKVYAPNISIAPEESQSCININEASEKDLIKLPGIGPVLAGRIVAYRIKKGRITSHNELITIKGIGKKKLEKIRTKLCF